MVSRRLCVFGVLAVLGGAGGAVATSGVASPARPPFARAAAVCRDFSNQAAAQKAHDTVDADHDGIYCEALPCPCSTTKSDGPAAPAPGLGETLRRLGRSIDLHRPTRTASCHVRGLLPDPRCTPGARYSGATRANVCRRGYAKGVRNVSTHTKDEVYAAYGVTRHFDGRDGEVDHLVSLELGGSNSRANLFPEAAPGSHEKDRLENALHDEVCSGRTSLRRAQRLIASDWVAAYRARFG